MASRLFLLTWLMLVISLSACAVHAAEPSFDWRSDWAVHKDFNVTIDTQGYRFPTSIAFVPHPGTSPKDPLYFVTELRGKVKVVTNDRTVSTFADRFLQLEAKEPPGPGTPVGMAGICLEPKHGYVFVTFAYQDANKILRNNIMRFHTTPQTFSIRPTSHVAFTEVFSADESGISHQIGPCQVNDNLLYVNVGNAEKTEKGQRLDTLLGKIVRMDLDGKPVPGNPFYQDDDVKKPVNYIWAYGLRNPFGLKISHNRVFVADNGPSVDRFLEVQAGGNYLYDGSDLSMGINANAVFNKGDGVAQLEYYPSGSSLFPKPFAQSFFLAVTGTSAGKKPRIIQIEYGFKESRLLSVPRSFLAYRGNTPQVVAGVGFGPDGLYFVPYLPNKEKMSAIFKIIYDPNHNYPFLLERESTPLALMREFNCLSCHSKGGVGPLLDRDVMIPRIEERLNSEEYLQTVKEVEHLYSEPFVSFKESREEILESKGIYKVRLWIKNHILEPRFDNPHTQMPNMGLSEKQALIITDYLLGGTDRGVLFEIKKSITGLLPSSAKRRQLLLFFIGGFSVGSITLTSFQAIFHQLRKPKA